MQDEAEWVLLDTETDGLNYPIHAVEIAAQRMRGTEKEGEPFRAFLNHDVPIPNHVVEIHGYTREFLRQHGMNPIEAYEKLSVYVGNRPISAHFLQYDWNAVLLPELRRLRMPPIGQQGMCTWNLARRVLPESHSHRLDLLRETHGLSLDGAHSAIGDIETVYLLLRNVIFPRLQQIGVTTYHEIFGFSRERPLLKCHCLVQGRDFESELRALNEQKAKRLKDEKAKQKLIDDIVCGKIPDLRAFVREQRLIAQDPEITVRGRTFLFTGKMIWGSRSQATSLIQSLGGFVSTSKSVSSKINYLVLGEDSEKGWTAFTRGGKLEDAVCKKIANKGCELCIILESDFINQLVQQVEVPQPALLLASSDAMAGTPHGLTV